MRSILSSALTSFARTEPAWMDDSEVDEILEMFGFVSQGKLEIERGAESLLL